jgi:hypothetical protein
MSWIRYCCRIFCRVRLKKDLVDDPAGGAGESRAVPQLQPIPRVEKALLKHHRILPSDESE